MTRSFLNGKGIVNKFLWIGEDCFQPGTQVFYDNVAEVDAHSYLCFNEPVDIVYTWVNGSDPIHLRGNFIIFLYTNIIHICMDINANYCI